MTCIVGYLDKKDGTVWLGGDSLGSDGYSKSVKQNHKVFKNENFKETIMGGTSTFRHLDLLEFSDTLFDELDCFKDVKVDRKFMVKRFIPNVINLFEKIIRHKSETERGGNFIVGTQGKLFEVQADYSVIEPIEDFCSVGSGENCALASLFTTKDLDMPIHKKIELALESAEKVGCFVQRPFRIINSKTDAEIIIT